MYRRLTLRFYKTILIAAGATLCLAACSKNEDTSAATLADAELETIRAALRKRFGREVEVESAVDAALIGGAVIDAGDVVIDGSLRGKLDRLQTVLAS